MNKFYLLGIATVITAMISCDDGPEVKTTRTYRMGFQNSAPRPDFTITIQALQVWTTRADAAIITTEVPWDSIYAGKSIPAFVINNYLGLVNFYRSKNFKLWVYIDPQNGLNRTINSNALVARNKSIADTDVQKLYRRFAVVMDSILRPEHLGLALETNLIRLVSSSAIYNGVKKAANDAVADVRTIDKLVKLSISIQADVAWGNPKVASTYLGIGQDYIDFPFIDELGISSYPYFSVDNPDDLPIDYYSRLVEGKSLPVFVSEGGWTTQNIVIPNQPTIKGSNEVQQKYIARQSQLLDKVNATALFQLTFTDIDLSSYPPSVDPNINFFVYLGMVDVNLQGKPAWETWGGIFKRTLR